MLGECMHDCHHFKEMNFQSELKQSTYATLIHLFLFVLKVKLQCNLKIFINQLKVPAN